MTIFLAIFTGKMREQFAQAARNGAGGLDLLNFPTTY